MMIFSVFKERAVLVLAALSIACLGTESAKADESDSAKKPNILFLLADDMGYGDLGCFGSPVIQSPHLDKLASQGVKLNQCYAGR